ncbi:MAG: homoaconitase, partial [Planctomycetota bacterium]|nr:homoaconitase [Planctomycetota bacterium]
MAQNLVEKIVQRFAVGLPNGQIVKTGDFVTVRPRHVMTHDNTAAVMLKFKGLGATEVNNPAQPVFTLDHNVQDTSENNLKKYSNIEAFGQKMGVDFHPAGRGIGHQIMIEEGYAWPGTLVVASDSHSNVYGGIGALGTPVVRTDAAALWATGETWWQIPPVTKVVLRGKLRKGVSGKDVIVSLCGLYNQDEVLNHALVFEGSGVSNLNIASRLTIANMTTEWGALTGIFPCDEKTVAWYREREGTHPALKSSAIDELEKSPLQADEDAQYAQVIELDLDSVVPCICGPHTVKVMEKVSDVETQKRKINKAYLLSCTNARVEDLAEAADVLKGKSVADEVGFYLAPASTEVQRESESRGDWATLLAAGAKVLPAGCGPCIGMGEGLLEDGEVGISATNRNFKGRMGSKDSEAYLASPAVVAASAIAGHICAPDNLQGSGPDRQLSIPPQPNPEATETPILEGFPTSIEGELLFCDADNLNTDGIYPGKYTYREDMSPEEMAAVAMENYDPKFQQLAQEGDLLVSGFNFGTGSSREQAATAIQFRGIPLVIAGSFSATYKRNAFNNGIVLVDCPKIVEWLRKQG